MGPGGAITVANKRDIKQYGSVAAAEEVRKAKRINAEISKLGLDNIESVAGYTTKYNKASAETKTVLDTPTVVAAKIKQATEELISENRIKINEKIAYYEAKNQAQKKSNRKREKYYEEKGNEEKAQQYNDRADEYDDYYDGIITGLRQGLGQATSYDSIYSYAKDLGRYEREKEEARNNEQAWERKNAPQMTTDITTIQPDVISYEGGKATKVDPNTVFIDGQGYSVAPELQDKFIADMKAAPKYSGPTSSNYSKPQQDFLNMIKPTPVNEIFVPKPKTSTATIPKQTGRYVNIDNITATKPTPGKPTNITIKPDATVFTSPSMTGPTVKAKDLKYVKPKTVVPDFLDPSKKKSELQVVQEMFNVPDLKEIKRSTPEEAKLKRQAEKFRKEIEQRREDAGIVNLQFGNATQDITDPYLRSTMGKDVQIWQNYDYGQGTPYEGKGLQIRPYTTHDPFEKSAGREFGDNLAGVATDIMLGGNLKADLTPSQWKDVNLGTHPLPTPMQQTKMMKYQDLNEEMEQKRRALILTSVNLNEDFKSGKITQKQYEKQYDIVERQVKSIDKYLANRLQPIDFVIMSESPEAKARDAKKKATTDKMVSNIGETTEYLLGNIKKTREYTGDRPIANFWGDVAEGAVKSSDWVAKAAVKTGGATATALTSKTAGISMAIEATQIAPYLTPVGDVIEGGALIMESTSPTGGSGDITLTDRERTVKRVWAGAGAVIAVAGATGVASSLSTTGPAGAAVQGPFGKTQQFISSKISPGVISKVQTGSQLAVGTLGGYVGVARGKQIYDDTGSISAAVGGGIGAGAPIIVATTGTPLKARTMDLPQESGGSAKYAVLSWETPTKIPGKYKSTPLAYAGWNTATGGGLVPSRRTVHLADDFTMFATKSGRVARLGDVPVKAGLGTPDISKEIVSLTPSVGKKANLIFTGDATTYKVLKKGVKSIETQNADLLTARAKGLWDPLEEFAGGVSGKSMKNIVDEDAIYQGTKYLTPDANRVAVEFAAEKKGIIFGSKARQGFLDKSYDYGGTKRLLDKTPGDVDIRFDYANKIQMQMRTDDLIARFKKLGDTEIDGKSFKYSTTREVPGGEFQIEAKINNKWEKITELKGPDMAEQAPEFVFGIRKYEKPVLQGVAGGKKVYTTNLPEESKALSESLAKVGKVNGKIDLFPGEERLKDIGAWSITARSTAGNLPAKESKKAFELIEQVESFYTPKQIMAQTKFAPTALDFRPANAFEFMSAPAASAGAASLGGSSWGGTSPSPTVVDNSAAFRFSPSSSVSSYSMASSLVSSPASPSPGSPSPVSPSPGSPSPGSPSPGSPSPSSPSPSSPSPSSPSPSSPSPSSPSPSSPSPGSPSPPLGFGIIDIDFGGQKRQKVYEQAYMGQVLVKGKYKTVTEKPKTKSGAFDKIARVIDNTISAQGKVIPIGKKKIVRTKANSGDGYFKDNDKKFRGFKMFGGKKIPLKDTIIEKKQHRIDTPGEARKMTVAQFTARTAKRAVGLPVRKKNRAPKRKKKKKPFRL